MKTLLRSSPLFILLALFFACVQSGDKSGKKPPSFETVPKVQNAKVSSINVEDDVVCDSVGNCVQIDTSAHTQFSICFKVFNATSDAILLNSAKVLIYQHDTPTDPVIVDTCQGSIAINKILMRGRDTIISRDYCVSTHHIFTANANLGFNLVYRANNILVDTTYILTRCPDTQ